MKIHINESVRGIKRIADVDFIKHPTFDVRQQVISTNNNMYSVYNTTTIDDPSFAQMSISMLSAYDDAKYAYAFLKDEVINYVDGNTRKIIKRKSFPMEELTPEDWDDIEYRSEVIGDWMYDVMDEAIATLDQINKDIKPVKAIY